MSGVLAITLRKHAWQLVTNGHSTYELYLQYATKRITLSAPIPGQALSPCSQGQAVYKRSLGGRKSDENSHHHHHHLHVFDVICYLYCHRNAPLARSQSSSNNCVDYLEAALRPLPMLLDVENQPTS